MVAGTPPIRAKKARYFEDARFQERVLPPPALKKPEKALPDDWSALTPPPAPTITAPKAATPAEDEDTTDSERRHQPELSRVEQPERKPSVENEFEIDPVDEPEEDVARNSRLRDTMRQVARQASLDPGDGIEL
jgi:type IV secretion system protein VirD4